MSAHRKRHQTLYDPTGTTSAADEHALDVSALVRELEAHLERLRHDEASDEEQRVVAAMVAAARRARRL